MIIPSNWKEIESKESGEFMNLSLGGHACKILDVREYTSEVSGNTSLKVSIDIDENNEFKDYFKRQYDNNNLSEKKWPSGAVKYLSTKSEQMSYLKGFITAVEKSNNIINKLALIFISFSCFICYIYFYQSKNDHVGHFGGV